MYSFCLLFFTIFHSNTWMCQEWNRFSIKLWALSRIQFIHHKYSGILKIPSWLIEAVWLYCNGLPLHIHSFIFYFSTIYFIYKYLHCLERMKLMIKISMYWTTRDFKTVEAHTHTNALNYINNFFFSYINCFGSILHDFSHKNCLHQVQ